VEMVAHEIETMLHQQRLEQPLPPRVVTPVSTVGARP